MDQVGLCGGVDALTARPRKGAPSKLTQEQQEEVRRLLSLGAEANGYPGQVWTTWRVADLIQHHLGVRYHPATMSDLLRELGWSQQQPIERASQRKEDAITDWKQIRWPALKKLRWQT
jgi:transposase